MEKCKQCKSPYELEDYDLAHPITKIMAEKNLCYKCAFWEYQHFMDTEESQRRSYGLPVIVSKFYGPTATANPRYHWFLPFYTTGRTSNCSIHPIDRFQPTYRVLFEDGRLYTVNNLWHQGEIPPTFYSKFQVNAKLITNAEALMLISRKDTKVAEDYTHYIISAEGLDQVFGISKKNNKYDV